MGGADLGVDLGVAPGAGAWLFLSHPPLLPTPGTPGPGQGDWSGVSSRLVPSRSQTCCRHFLLAQLRDGSHVVLGEDSTHARLQDLLQHYTACPLGPYGETLSQPLARQVRRAPTLTWDPGSDLLSQSPGRGSRLRMLSRGTDCRPRLPRTRVSVASPSGKMPSGAQGSSRDQPSHRDRRG